MGDFGSSVIALLFHENLPEDSKSVMSVQIVGYVVYK
jgi:hypothetical protein